MRTLLFIFSLVVSTTVVANDKSESVTLSQQKLTELVIQLNDAQNKVMKKGSTLADVDALFDLYTEDFTYVHEVYGGVYTREHLYRNTTRYLKSGGYNKTKDRYLILNTILGDNAVAIQRLEDSGAMHLSVIEFDGEKVQKIIEYWK